jgi:Leucine-rich repeat (LRR) protein
MTEKQIEHGFWLLDKANQFPPDAITYPSEYEGGKSVNIACTQLLDFKTADQKKLIKQWTQFLPTCSEIEMLWFTSQISQELFDGICMMNNLVGLNIKWSNIKSLDSITNLNNLKYLRIGDSAKIESIEPVASLTNLEVLVIENFKKICDFSLLSALTNLNFLSIEGGIYTKQKVESFEFVSNLINLIYFSTAMISCPDKRIDPILKLKKLVTLNWSFALSKKEVERLKVEIPKLKYLPHRYYEGNIKKIKALFG